MNRWHEWMCVCVKGWVDVCVRDEGSPRTHSSGSLGAAPTRSLSVYFLSFYTHTHTHIGVWILSDYAWHTEIERLKLHAR